MFTELARGVTAYGTGMVKDTVGALGGLRGDDPDDWDPDYIRDTLPLLKNTFGAYFRGEVRGLDNIPSDGPSLLVGNHSGGTLIADTFVFARVLRALRAASGASTSSPTTSPRACPGSGISR